jgi:predicted ATPase
LINLLSSTSSFFPEGGIISNLIPLPLKKGKRDFLTVFSELREKPVGPPPGRDSLLDYIVNQFNEAIDKITILSHPNIKLTKAPNLPRKEEILIEDGSNLNSVLYNWFLAHNKLPERIETALFQLFPETQIRFQLTTDGKVYIQLLEKGLKLPPPCIADGFYKILIVLLALESNPSLILIDELENSLYAEALQYVIDELKNSRTTVIITTHSPVVVDMVDLNDLLIAERTINGTQFKKIRNVQKMRKRLAELKITPSESWLSGVFYDDKTADFK